MWRPCSSIAAAVVTRRGWLHQSGAVGASQRLFHVSGVCRERRKALEVGAGAVVGGGRRLRGADAAGGPVSEAAGRHFTLHPPEMVMTYEADRAVGEAQRRAQEAVPSAFRAKVEEAAPLAGSAGAEAVDGAGADGEPLAANLRNTPADTPYRVSWYDYGSVSPGKAFVYWSFRRLRELPPEWREYYRRLLMQEIVAARFVQQPWDVFMLIVDGYRKCKWVLCKYAIPIDDALIPRPYNNFWEETTHEERVWAHRRSHQLKELQALQRDEDTLVFGAGMMDRREVTYNASKNLQTGMQGGSPVHAFDLAAPAERDIAMSRQDEEMSSALMSSIEDDKLWNPVLKSRIHTQKLRDETELYGFEDEEEDEEADGEADGPGRSPLAARGRGDAAAVMPLGNRMTEVERFVAEGRGAAHSAG